MQYDSCRTKHKKVSGTLKEQLAEAFREYCRVSAIALPLKTPLTTPTIQKLHKEPFYFWFA